MPKSTDDKIPEITDSQILREFGGSINGSDDDLNNSILNSSILSSSITNNSLFNIDNDNTNDINQSNLSNLTDSQFREKIEELGVDTTGWDNSTNPSNKPPIDVSNMTEEEIEKKMRELKENISDKTDYNSPIFDHKNTRQLSDDEFLKKMEEVNESTKISNHDKSGQEKPAVNKKPTVTPKKINNAHKKTAEALNSKDFANLQKKLSGLNQTKKKSGHSTKKDQDLQKSMDDQNRKSSQKLESLDKKAQNLTLEIARMFGGHSQSQEKQATPEKKNFFKFFKAFFTKLSETFKKVLGVSTKKAGIEAQPANTTRSNIYASVKASETIKELKLNNSIMNEMLSGIGSGEIGGKGGGFGIW